MRVLRWVGLGLALLVLAGISIYTLRPEPPPPVDFVDDLKGPTTPNLAIPFDAYTLTPEGLLRIDSASDRSYAQDRPLVKTRSGAYLTRDFVFEVDVTIPADTEDIAFVGFGRAESNPGFSMEPAASFVFRIHRLSGMDVVHAAAASPPRRSDERVPGHYRVEPIGKYVAGTTTRFRIERAGGRVTLSMPDTQGAGHTFELESFPGLFDERSSYLFFGNSAEGTVFSNVRVRPRG